MSTNPPLSALPGEVRAALARLDMTQTELAQRTGRSAAYWSARLRGGRPMSTSDLESISRITGVPVIVLIEGAAS